MSANSRPTGFRLWLQRRYLRRVGRYYCAVVPGSMNPRSSFPFRHKKIAMMTVKLKQARSSEPWVLYRYGTPTG